MSTKRSSPQVKTWIFRINLVMVVLISLLWGLEKIDTWAPLPAIPGMIGAIAFFAAAVVSEQLQSKSGFQWELRNFLFGMSVLGFIIQGQLSLMFTLDLALELDKEDTSELQALGLSWEYILYGALMAVLAWYSVLYIQYRRKLVQ